MKALGDFISGEFHAPAGEEFRSTNPAKDHQVVFATRAEIGRVALAADAAEAAHVDWSKLSIEERYDQLLRFRACLKERRSLLEDALVAEVGKLRAEARGEVGALLSRFELVRSASVAELKEGPLAGHPGESLRFHALGAVGVIGPYNYPLHLVHAHALPALLLGNSVVVKASEVAPLCAQLYAEAAAAAELPPGVFNLVQGGGPSGAALVANRSIRGLCFTGSYPIGRRILETALDRPELLVALEMGGKNTVVVAEDADMRQAAHEIVVGGFLTTGQRCTCTDRVLAHESLIEPLQGALTALVGNLKMGDPDSSESFAGPLATNEGRDKVEEALAQAKEGGAKALVEGGRIDGGSFLRASLHLVPATTDIAGYTDSEVFGPDISLQPYGSDDEAISILNRGDYGLANSVFTSSNERFERYYAETRSGILNRNRSTNQASPRLPFGGVGKSGNYRPAGAHAPRNVVSAVAVMENVIGRIAVHPKLADFMPPPQLDRLEAQHVEEEHAEASRRLVDLPRPMTTVLPKDGRLPSSDAWLMRLYAADRVVREKKPPVFDHLRSAGPWLVSVDDTPLSVLDGMSQTATLCGGFSEDHVVRAYTEGAFGNSLVKNHDPATEEHSSAYDFATVLRQMVPGLPHVTYANSGAEANDKALALARLHAEDKGASKVLAFEGSFHGRTLLPLSLTYNPAKRGPYEVRGYEGNFAPFPLWLDPGEGEPMAPSGFYAAAGHGDIDELEARFGSESEDPLLASEVQSLRAVNEALATKGFFACVIEPMQSEGGDRYATSRFFRALRLLTRHHGVPLIMDEVQTGFGLGGEFAWHTRFQFVNVRGQPDFPDAVVFAKRAQLGVVMSVWDDPELTSVQSASLIRGRLHAEMVATQHASERIEKLVKERLHVIHQGFPHLVGDPRASGFAFAFDLPSPKHLGAYLGQRFWRGAVVFGAGSKTVRYRLNDSYLAKDIDRLFETVRRSLAWLDAHPGQIPPAWENMSEQDKKRRDSPDVRIRAVTSKEAVAFLPSILDIELAVYEPARRTPPAQIRAALEDTDGVTTVAEVLQGDTWVFVGFAIGQPLEAAAPNEEGPDRDVMLGRNNTLYSVSLTVSGDYQGLGIGRKLKEAQLREAAGRKSRDGKARFQFVSGRNRIGLTAAMTHLNRAFGAHLVDVLTGQYEDPEGQAVYYRMPIGALAPARQPEGVSAPRLDSGISAPFHEPPASLAQAEKSGLLFGPAVNKLTVMNYATPALVRGLEWVSAMVPKLPHMYLTSCRDELVDKSLRILRTHRKEAQMAIGMVGGYVGHTTAAARSISDPGTHAQGPRHFDWPLLPHPEDVGMQACEALLRELIEEVGGAHNVLGLYAEPVQERTGRSFSGENWKRLRDLCNEFELPLVAVETASAMYRNGVTGFAINHLATPDLLAWWGGAHTGYLHCSSELRVATPLAMVSTWDGDELSLIRDHHHLRAARGVDLEALSSAWEEALRPASEAGLKVRGRGLYRVLHGGARSEEIFKALQGEGLSPRSFRGGHLAFIPPFDRASELASQVGDCLKELLS